MFGTLARLALGAPKRVLLGVLLLAVVAGVASSGVFSRMQGGGFKASGAESGQAERVLKNTFGTAQPNLVLLVRDERGVDDPETARAGAALTRRLAAEPEVTDVRSYWALGRPAALRGSDGHAALVLARVTGDNTEVASRMTDLAPRYQGTVDGLDVTPGGYAMVQHELTEMSEEDATTGEIIVFPITLVILVLVFGSVVAALLPLAVAVVTIMVSLLAAWGLSTVTDVSVLMLNVVTFLGLGLAIDYSLLIVSRYREELARGRTVAEAIGTTLRTAGRTVAFSSVTVAMALVSMAVFPMFSLRSMAYVGVVTALIAAASSLVVLPALLVALGHRVDRFRVIRRRPRSRRAEAGFWHRLATVVMRRPVPVASLIVVVLLLMGAPFLGINLRTADERVLPESAASYQVAHTIRTRFAAGEQNALRVVAPHAEPKASTVDDYARRLSRLPNVARVTAATGTYHQGERVADAPRGTRFTVGDATYLSVVPTEGNETAKHVVKDVRAAQAPFRVLVGGTPAVNVDSMDALRDRLPWAGGIVALGMLILLFLLTGSVVLPLIGVTLSALSLTATFGALVWIFQDGHLTELLGGITATGGISATVPVMLFALAFGLAMDYQVFLLSRIHEEYRRSGDNTTAVAMGLERIGRIVTAAAVLISIVFLGFLPSGITFVKAFGVGVPLAVLMDATLIRGALLPATMRLLGRAVWWAPAPLRRLHERVGLTETGEGPSDASEPQLAER